jgi:hypothetical protein
LLVDRLVHRRAIVRIDGESCRKEEAGERIAARSRQRAAKPRASTAHAAAP